MLTIFNGSHSRDCDGITRRGFIRAGMLGLGGLSLPWLLQNKAQAASESLNFVRDKAVVLLFLHGGPPHIEFFDPKMTAPEDIRSTTGETPTALPGYTFGYTMQRMAERAKEFAIVRSFASGNGGHTYQAVSTGGNPTKASMGALYCRLAGPNNLLTGMPSSVSILPEAVDPDLKLGKNFETGALPTLWQTGDLPATFAPFDPSSGGQLKQNLELRLPRERFEDRKTLLSQLDTFKRQVDKTKAFDSVDGFQQQAYDVILRGVANAFDLKQESARTLERYDTTDFFRNEDLQKYYDMKRACNTLGKQMLLARRLVEAGCGFVTVSDCGWDYHANNNSPKNMAGLGPMSGQVDHAVTAFVEDLKQRGLSDKVLLVVTGEMGRSPKVNKNGGRDHWANLTALALAGGGLKMGQVIGQSDKQAGSPATEKYTPAHLMSTIFNVLFDVGQLRLARGLPAGLMKFVEDSKPIPELF